MDETTIKTPGVYINEENAFGSAVTSIASAVPAFIGYTPQASYQGKSYLDVPQKITSLSEFEAIYRNPNLEKQYSPAYYLVKQDSLPEKGNFMKIGGDYYAIVPDPNTIYYLYNSIKLFFQNGGSDAYIVSVGSYGSPSGKPMTPGDQIINPNVRLTDLKRGLTLLKDEQEPSMYIFPEATLLSVADNSTLMQEMLSQNKEMGTAVSILDIIGGRNPDPILYTNDIEIFRNNTGSNGLAYGAAYYPFIGTTVMNKTDIDYTNLFGGDKAQLEALLSPADAPNPAVAAILSNLGASTVAQNQAALMNASETYGQIIGRILSDANMLPPSGAVAGVITEKDKLAGPWLAPANTSITGAVDLSIKLSNDQQENLNVDAISGKSINSIRHFQGMGIIIWGARTLDGNSLDWRYLPVRRTITFIEQSCKLAIHAYVFEPNHENTWKGVVAMITNYLTDVWKQGGLQGNSTADAFSVQCGLGTTMTTEDISEGLMRVSVKVAVSRPAEFIELSFEQEMAKS